MPAPILYSINPAMPEKYMLRYALDSGNTSAGVFIRRSMLGVMAMPMAVKTTDSTSVIMTAVCTASFTLSYLPAP